MVDEEKRYALELKELTNKFRFTYDGEELFYGDEGVGTDVSYIIVDANNIHGPSRVKWYMGAIYYQIFVDSFKMAIH